MSILWPIIVIQIGLAARVLGRMIRSAGGTAIVVRPGTSAPPGSISVIVPVLDEFDRIGRCLETLADCGHEVGEILVVDGGSTDGTQKTVGSYAAADARIRLIDATPVPSHWNGKAWGLDTGLRASSPDASWIATIDADVRVRPLLLAATVEQARRRRIDALSVATQQELGDATSAIVHPAMLSTLVYRYGLPGNATTDPAKVQANGQCFMARRPVLIATKAFARARASVCEDVTAARVLVRAGHAVGFYEAGDAAVVRMHDTWHGVWQNWPRSLTLRDGVPPADTIVGLAEIFFVQALPLIVVLLLIMGGHDSPARTAAFGVNAVLLMMRIGVLAGTRRAYRNPAWTYWLSLLADLPVASALIASALRRRHRWRGRTLVMSERNT